MYGGMKYTKLFSKPSTGFGGSFKCTKLLMDYINVRNGSNLLKFLHSVGKSFELCSFCVSIVIK